jgi:hypothetical protein
MNKLKSILLLAAIALTIYFSFITGKRVGYNNGVDYVLDTVLALVERQVDSDTSVTELNIINPDTNRYFLSRKTMLTK